MCRTSCSFVVGSTVLHCDQTCGSTTPQLMGLITLLYQATFGVQHVYKWEKMILHGKGPYSYVNPTRSGMEVVNSESKEPDATRREAMTQDQIIRFTWL